MKKKHLKNYEILYSIQDIHLKDCQLIQIVDNPSEKYLLKRIKSINCKDDIIDNLISHHNENLINLLDFEKIENEEFYEYYLYFDPFITDLAIEMKARQIERNYFSENEIWEILTTILKALCFYHDKEIFHGYIEPNYIKFVKNDANDYEILTAKLFHPLIKELIREGDENLDSEERIYLSPEEFIGLKYEETKTYIDFFKSDVYCLGLCLLEAATFFSIKSCYNWETFLMNYEFILRKLLIIHNRYSKHLAYILKMMLVIEDKVRPSIFEIEILLTKEEEIEKTKRSLYLSPMRNKYNVEINSENRKKLICEECKDSLHRSCIENKSKIMTPKLKYTPIKNTENPKSAVGFSTFFVTSHKQSKFQNKIQAISGSYFEGDWKSGHIEGKGKLYYPSGKLAYEGEWKNDCFHGKGVFHQESSELNSDENYENDPNKIIDNWVTYIGSFEKDLKHGKGRLILNNGTVFDGEFLQGMISGPGVLTLNNGEKIVGTWKDNILVDSIK